MRPDVAVDGVRIRDWREGGFADLPWKAHVDVSPESYGITMTALEFYGGHDDQHGLRIFS